MSTKAPNPSLLKKEAAPDGKTKGGSVVFGDSAVLTPEISAELERLGIEEYAKALREDGYVVVPPEVTGMTLQLVDELVGTLLRRSEELVGVPFTLEGMPAGIEWPEGSAGTLTGEESNQFLLTQTAKLGRCQRDLAIHPVAVALTRSIIGPSAMFSSFNCFLKGQGQGYGPSLGLHCDQGAVPLPWGDIALNCNCTWALTDYTLEDGGLACVPRSHELHSHPTPDAPSQAIPVECKRGSLIVFGGQLWHGAFPKQTPGLRIALITYFRHSSVQTQDDIGHDAELDALAEDCADPQLFRALSGYAGENPATGVGYTAQAMERLPVRARV